MKGASCPRQGATMGSFHTDMEVRTPTVGIIIISGPFIINRNALLPEINELVFAKVSLDLEILTFLHVLYVCIARLSPPAPLMLI